MVEVGLKRVELYFFISSSFLSLTLSCIELMQHVDHFLVVLMFIDLDLRPFKLKTGTSVTSALGTFTLILILLRFFYFELGIHMGLYGQTAGQTVMWPITTVQVAA